MSYLRKKGILVASVAAIMLTTIGCGAESQPLKESEDKVKEVAGEQDKKDEADTGKESKEIVVKDMDEAEITLQGEAEKVVNQWPSATSTMVVFGAGEKLIAVPSFSKTLTWTRHMYPEVMNLPDAPDSTEELLALDPDVIVVPGSEEAKAYREAGLPAMNLLFKDYDTMKSAFLKMGDAFGEEYMAKAKAWGTYVDESIAEVTTALADLKEEDKPVVYYISAMNNGGLYKTMNQQSIINHWTNLAGGIYAAELADLDGSEFSAEEILKINPDVIIVGGQAQKEVYDELMADPAWQNIKALQNDRVYTNPFGNFGWDRFGAESALQIKFAASIINPEIYKVDMVAEAQGFYKEFAGVELTEQEAKYMLEGRGPNGEGLQVK